MPPVANGKPVAFVSAIDDGVPPAPLNRTGAPAEPTLTPSAANTPVPAPVKPVEIGRPAPFVSVIDDGVPPAPLNSTGAPADPVFTPSAVAIPVPSPVMLPIAGVMVADETAVSLPSAFQVTIGATVALPVGPPAEMVEVRVGLG